MDDWRTKNPEDWTTLDHHNAIWHDWATMAEFMELLANGEIPQGSKLVLATIERESDSKEVTILPVKIAILPNGQPKILDSSVNSDILRKEMKETGGIPASGKMLEIVVDTREIEIPDNLIPPDYAKCPDCGRAFRKSGKRIFCSDECRVRHHSREWQRKKAAADQESQKE